MSGDELAARLTRQREWDDFYRHYGTDAGAHHQHTGYGGLHAGGQSGLPVPAPAGGCGCASCEANRPRLLPAPAPLRSAGDDPPDTSIPGELGRWLDDHQADSEQRSATRRAVARDFETLLRRERDRAAEARSMQKWLADHQPQNWGPQ